MKIFKTKKRRKSIGGLINGIPIDIHQQIMKECGLTTKKATIGRRMEYEKARRLYIKNFIDPKCYMPEEMPAEKGYRMIYNFVLGVRR